MKKRKSGPGPNGRQTLDCGCWRDNLIQYRCALHVAAPKMRTAIKHLRAAIVTLMGEVTNQRATKWGIVNDSLIESDTLLRETEGP